MNNRHLTFVHGWGCGPDIWQPLIDQLAGLTCHTINLGFTSDVQDIEKSPLEKSIYITHSLGAMWALKNRRDHMQALIVINGFSCFKTFTSPRILKRMQQKLNNDPRAQMQDFWSATGLPPRDHLNQGQLKHGLDWLESWDYANELDQLTCPVTAIFGNNDPILDTSLMQDHWRSYECYIIDNGGHNLPVTHHHKCAETIKEFINAF